MLLKEKDLEQFEKKIVYDCCYCKDDRDNVSMFGYKPYYDLGEGFYDNYKKKSNKITLTKSSVKSAPLESEKDLDLFVKSLYADALKNGYPIFLRFGKDYLFLNEYAFNRPAPKEEFKKVGEKYKEVLALMKKYVQIDPLVRAEKILYEIEEKEYRLLKLPVRVYKL